MFFFFSAWFDFFFSLFGVMHGRWCVCACSCIALDHSEANFSLHRVSTLSRVMGSAAEKAFGDFHSALVFPLTPPTKGRCTHNYSQHCMFEGKQAANWNSGLWHNWIIGKTISTRAPRLPGAENLFCDGLLINAARENGESSPAFPSALSIFILVRNCRTQLFLASWSAKILSETGWLFESLAELSSFGLLGFEEAKPQNSSFLDMEHHLPAAHLHRRVFNIFN